MSNALGFLDIAAGITSIIATTASAGVSAWATIEGLDLAEKQQELQAELATKRFALEEQLAQAQLRIYALQASGIEGRQSIEIEIAAMQRDALADQLEQIRRQQEMQTRLVEERSRIELAQLEWRLAQEEAARNRIVEDPQVQEEFDSRVSEEIARIESEQEELADSVLSGRAPVPLFLPTIPEENLPEGGMVDLSENGTVREPQPQPQSAFPTFLFAAGILAFYGFSRKKQRKGQEK